MDPDRRSFAETQWLEETTLGRITSEISKHPSMFKPLDEINEQSCEGVTAIDYILGESLRLLGQQPRRNHILQLSQGLETLASRS